MNRPNEKIAADVSSSVSGGKTKHSNAKIIGAIIYNKLGLRRAP
ncbi:MAG TPA: hypothetical protein PKV93_11845 [Fervidobacterium sp.]|nr:hypothetical protein [Fervidobacterium sp.]